MNKKNVANRLKVAVAAAAVMAGTLAPNCVAFAAATTEADALDETDTQTYTTKETTADDGTTSYSGAWAPSTNTDSDSDGYNDGGAGEIQIVYDTTGGSWYDSGDDDGDGDMDSADGTTTGNETAHNNGTYLVTIPKLIKYENMNIGEVNTSNDYTINVKGAIPSSKKVTLTAEVSTQPTTGSDSITATLTHTKTEWTASECFGDSDSATDGNQVNTDKSLHGTDQTDNIALSGTAMESDSYEGIVTYTASMG